MDPQNEEEVVDDNIEETESNDEPISDMREALNAAIEEHSTPDEEPEEEAPEEDEAGANEAPAPENEAPEAEEASSEELPTGKNPVNVSKPPVGWKGGSWDNVPKEAKEAIVERERGIAMAMQQSSEARKVAGSFGQTMTKHRNTLESLGFQDPMQGLDSLLSNVGVLKNGTPDQKAQGVAALIREFGVDIGMLDDVLDGNVAPQQQHNAAQFEQLLDQRLAPVNSLMQQLEAHNYQATMEQQQAAANEANDFVANNKYADQVRNQMADLLDIAASQGRNMTMQEAYDAACMGDPSIRAEIIAAEREEQAAAARAQTQAKRQAASSVSGGPAGASARNPGNSIADAIRDAFEQHSL